MNLKAKPARRAHHNAALANPKGARPIQPHHLIFAASLTRQHPPVRLFVTEATMRLGHITGYAKDHAFFCRLACPHHRRDFSGAWCVQLCSKT